MAATTRMARVRRLTESTGGSHHVSWCQRVLVVTGSPPVAQVMLYELARELGATPEGNRLTIERTKPMADASLTVISAQHPPALLGNRFDLVVVDRSSDTFDLAELNRQWTWFNVGVFTRMTHYSRAIVLEHNHDENDLAHRLLANGWLGSTWAADEPALSAWSKRHIDHERLRNDLGCDMYRQLYLCKEIWKASLPQSEQVVGGIDAPAD